jgi:hypothetical protein
MHVCIVPEMHVYSGMEINGHITMPTAHHAQTQKIDATFILSKHRLDFSKETRVASTEDEVRCVYTRAYIYIYIYIYIYVCMYICMYVCIYMRLNACLRICTCILACCECMQTHVASSGDGKASVHMCARVCIPYIYIYIYIYIHICTYFGFLHMCMYISVL